MKNKLYFQIGIGVLIVATIGLVSVYFIQQYKKAYMYCYKFVGAKINSFGLKKADVTVSMKIFNPSDLNVKATQQEYKVYVNDKYISTITSNKTIYLNAMNAATVPLNIVFSPLQVLGVTLLNLDNLTTQKDNLVFRIDGVLSIYSGGVSLKNFKFSIEETLAEILAPSTDDFCNKIKY